MKVAVVGATGLVGSKMLEILSERNFPVTELILVASERSAGSKVEFKGELYTVVTPARGVELKPDVAIFSAGGDVSKEWAPKFAEIGCRVVDNSSCWRMDPTKKLVIPEINGDVLTKEDLIIANPNCSTIQMLVAIAPLHKAFGIKRIVVSTYQSVTGTGQKGVNQLVSEREGKEQNGTKQAYKYQIDLNLIPQIDSFTDNGYTKEELKMVNETHKIMGDSSIGVSPTTVRVPVMGGHSESVNLEFEKEFTLEQIFDLLSKAPGVTLQDDTSAQVYPMPLFAEGKDDVFVGRIRRDISREKSLNMWVVSDNLRKGAATNAVQIAEILLKKGFIG
jgi:aspartate-semialdehyde dehydrogenase